jgi:hypothetical protein
VSDQAQQAALGYFLAWLEAHQDDAKVMAPVVRSFGAIHKERGGIHCVRVKVFGIILTVVPWSTEPEVVPQPIEEAAEEMRAGLEAASGVHPVQQGVALHAPEHQDETRPNYGGAERYKCPSCGARQWNWCRSKSGVKSYRAHSSREHMVT